MPMSLARKLFFLVLAAAIVAAALYAWSRLGKNGPGEGFVSGNGRIEATEIDVATKLAGRVEDILVDEGDFVEAGQPLAHMQVTTLQAQRDEALAQQQQAVTAVASAKAQVAMRESDMAAAQAVVAQRETELDAARRRCRARRRWRSRATSRARNWTMTAPRCAAPRPRSAPPGPRWRPPRRRWRPRVPRWSVRVRR